MLKLNKIYNVDALDGLKKLDDESINLVVTSPPYNVGLGNNKYNKNSYDLYIDNLEHEKYIEWLRSIFQIIYKKLVDSGRVCINIGDGKNGAVPTSSDIIQFMNDLNYIPYTHIIWNKSQVGNRTSWGSFQSPSSPSFPTPFEHILVFFKKSRKLKYKGETDLTKDEFIKWSLALWNFPPETKQKVIGHPAMFPLELPIRCIKMFSYIGDIVLDPFCGAGTTCLATKQLNRKYIGIDISEKYCKMARDRLKNVQMKLI